MPWLSWRASATLLRRWNATAVVPLAGKITPLALISKSHVSTSSAVMAALQVTIASIAPKESVARRWILVFISNTVLHSCALHRVYEVDVYCYMLNDSNKVTQTGVMVATVAPTLARAGVGRREHGRTLV